MSRPTPITVLGIINIVWGVLTLLSSLLGIATLFAMPYFVNLMASMPPPTRGGPAPGSPSPAAMFSMWKDPTYLACLSATHGLHLIGGAILLAAGIGLLRMRNWGRVGSLVYAGWAFMSIVASQVISWTIFMPITNRMMKSMGGPGMPPISMTTSITIISMIIGIGLSLAYPIVLTVYMTRPWLIRTFTMIPAVVEALPASSPSVVTEEQP